MKIGAYLLFALFLSQGAFSHSMIYTLAEPRFWSITTEPIGIFLGDFHIQNETRLSDAVALVSTVGLFNPNWAPFRVLTGLDPTGFNGFTFPGWIIGGGLGLKLYPFGKALASGLYTEFLVFGGGGQTFGLNQGLAMIQQRFYVGYNWVAESGFVFDLYGGFQQSNFSMVEGQGFIPTAGLQFGYAI